jgi:peptidoglycan hydrolase-like protein with peptidoglycan-binding domain
VTPTPQQQVQIVRRYQNAAGRSCRVIRQSVFISGMTVKALGTVCQQPDGRRALMGLDPDHLPARGSTPSPTPRLATAAPSPVDPTTTRAAQMQLCRLRLYHGPVDGIWGRNTRLALEHFQRQHGEAVTGEPSRRTLMALGLKPQLAMSGSSVPPTHRAADTPRNGQGTPVDAIYGTPIPGAPEGNNGM